MKFLRAFALVIAVACTTQAADGLMPFPVSAPTTEIGTELLRLMIESVLFLF